MGGSNITRETNVNVEDMGEQEAILLLLKSAWLDESSPDMQQAATPIALALCCFPLALDQAGAAIRSGLCTIDGYLAMYSAHRQRLMGHSSYDGASNYGRAVYVTWDLSFVAIETRAAGSDLVAANAATSAIVILQTFAFLHHSNISDEIIKRAAEAHRDYNAVDPGRQASYDLILPLLQLGVDGSWDPLFFREGIQVLLSFSLIRQSVTGHVYSIHPLVHFWSHDRMLQEEQQSRCLSANILLSLSITFEYSKEDYAFRRTLIPHIKVSQNGVQTGISIPYDDDQCSRFGLALSENGLWEDAERLDIQVMETRSRVLESCINIPEPGTMDRGREAGSSSHGGKE